MKQSALFSTIAALLIASSSLLAQHHEPLKLSPDNPHYFIFRGQPTVLVTSGEHYGSVVNRDFDYSIYLDQLQRDHLNLTRLFSGSYLEIQKPHDATKGGYTIDHNTLAPTPERFVSPWKSKVRADGRILYDLHHWNPRYFARLHDFLRQAGRRGIVVELSLFCQMYEQSLWEVSPLNSRNNANQTEDVPYTEVYNLQHPLLQEAEDNLVRKLIAETLAFDNLYFELINEPYWHSVTPQWQRHISGLIHGHLISQNYANFSERVRDPDPNISIFNFHYARPPDSVGMNYNLNRAIGMNETGFDGASDAAYRIQGWDFLTAGGALYNNLDFSFADGYERGTFAYADYTPGGGSEALRKQLGYLSDFFNHLDLPKLRPSPDALERGDYGGASVRVLAEAGKQYVVYVHWGRVAQNQKPQYLINSEPHRTKLLLRLPAGRYRYGWVDPKCGRTVDQGDVAATGGTVEILSPEYREDIALRILPKGV